MSNSPLIDGVLLTNNCSAPRNHSVDTITPHYMAWFTTAKACCESFVPKSRKASANYCIGKDGEIWLNVEEKNRAWTSGNSSNDNRAITIECANYTDSQRRGMLPDATWNSLVNLCVDICKRYGKKRLVYKGSANRDGLLSTDMLLTMHKWFQDTDCPGPWLSKMFGVLATEVTNKLSGVTPTPTYAGTYRVNVDVLNVRDKPSVKDGGIIAHYTRGALVELENYRYVCDGFVWGRYLGQTSKQYRYVAIGPYTGKPEATDYLIKVS